MECRIRRFYSHRRRFVTCVSNPHVVLPVMPGTQPAHIEPLCVIVVVPNHPLGGPAHLAGVARELCPGHRLPGEMLFRPRSLQRANRPQSIRAFGWVHGAVVLAPTREALPLVAGRPPAVFHELIDW